MDSIGPADPADARLASGDDGNLREMSDSIRPAVESTVGSSRGPDAKAQRELAADREDHHPGRRRTGQAQGYLVDNRENDQADAGLARDLLASVNDIIAKDRPKVERLLDGVEMSRLQRRPRALLRPTRSPASYSAMVAHSRPEIERSVTNIRDATDWANKLVQKIFTNPFVLSPFYKPNHEDLRVGIVYDTVLVSPKGAQELHDSVKTIERWRRGRRRRSSSRSCFSFNGKSRRLDRRAQWTSTRLAEGLKRPAGTARERTLR